MRAEIGEQLRAARLAAGLSQEALANLAEVDRPSVVRIEAGQHNPTLNTLIRICNVVGMQITLTHIP